MKRTRILLVDDSAVFAHAAKDLLTADGRLEVIGWASSGLEALERVKAEHPDIVVMDLHMPEMNGLEATTLIKADRFPPKVIVVSLEDAATNRRAAHIAGADAFLGKARFGAEIPGLIERLAAPLNPRPAQC